MEKWQWLIIQNTLNEAHLLKESRKPIVMAARTTMALDAVLAVSETPLTLWRMRQRLYSRLLNGLCRTIHLQGLSAADATRKTTTHVGITVRIAVL